jgi:hypothetical protein
MSTTSPFDAVENVSTLGAIVLGAVVATIGSFAASWYERRLLRREREADAALVFAEVLRLLALQISVVRAAHARGDPFGPITVRMVRGVRREIEIYERNRERLFMVRDAQLRPRASTLVARLSFAAERVLDNTDALASGATEAERAELMAGRVQAFEFLVESADELPALIDRFAALAGTPLADFDLASIGFAPPPRKQD